MEKREIIICRGIPASGKSTWAMRWAEEDPVHRIRINMDSLRRMFGKYWVVEREPLVARAMQGLLMSAIDEGYNIVIDNMNLDQKAIDKILGTVAVASKYSEKFEYIISTKCFNTDLEECIARDQLREGDQKITENVIRMIYEKHKRTIETMKDEILPLC